MGNNNSLKDINLDYSVFIVALFLTCFGLIMIFSASNIYSHARWNDATYFLKKEILWIIISTISMIGAAFGIDYRKLKELAPALLIVSIFLLLIVLIPGIGKEISGARRWLKLGFFMFHPAEFSKLILIIFTATVLSNLKNKIRNLKYFLFLLGIVGMICLLILKEPDFGLCIVLVSICLAMMFIAGAKISHIFAIILIGLPTAYLLILHEPYRVRRLLGFLHFWEDPQGTGFQIIQSLIAVASGGFFGRGLGLSQQKRFYLPEQHTDFIFSIIIEEIGFIGMAVLILLLCFLLYRGIKIALNAPDTFGMLLAFGITFAIAFQAFINMGVAIGILPITGLTFPFVSFGGTSLLTSYISIGLLLNISMKKGIKHKRQNENTFTNNRGDRRTHLPSFSGS